MADETRDTTDTMKADAGDAAKAASERMADVTHEAGEQMRAGADRAQEAFQDRVIDPMRRGSEALKQSGERVAKGSSQIGVKMIDQAETNAQEAFAAMRAAAGANDLAEVMKIQGDYLREQGQRSMSQAREIGELIMQFGRDAIAPLRGADPQR